MTSFGPLTTSSGSSGAVASSSDTPHRPAPAASALPPTTPEAMRKRRRVIASMSGHQVFRAHEREGDERTRVRDALERGVRPVRPPVEAQRVQQLLGGEL